MPGYEFVGWCFARVHHARLNPDPAMAPCGCTYLYWDHFLSSQGSPPLGTAVMGGASASTGALVGSITTRVAMPRGANHRPSAIRGARTGASIAPGAATCASPT